MGYKGFCDVSWVHDTSLTGHADLVIPGAVGDP